MTGTNGVEVEDGVHQNGDHIAPLKERTAKEDELLEQMRERIAVLDPGSKVSSWLGVGCSLAAHCKFCGCHFTLGAL